MGKKKKNKRVELNYEFDRLGFKKLSMVYALLVPLINEPSGAVHPINKEDEISSDIHQSVFRPTEGSTDHRESGQ